MHFVGIVVLADALEASARLRWMGCAVGSPARQAQSLHLVLRRTLELVGHVNALEYVIAVDLVAPVCSG